MFFDELFEQADEILEKVENIHGLDGLCGADNFEDIKNNTINVSAELRDDIEAFNGSEVLITGAPFEAAEYLDSAQGDNAYGFLGDCGLTSAANVLTLCGDITTEDEIVEFAYNNGLCVYDPEGDPGQWGGTSAAYMEEILESYGVEASISFPFETAGSAEGLAEALEEGHVVSVGVNAGYLWDKPEYVDDGGTNHFITLTGTVRDPETGELAGFVICDSGRCLESDSCRVITLEEFDESYTDSFGACAIITDEAYRASGEAVEI